MNIQTFSFDNQISVSFQNDGFLNATAIAAHFGKVTKDYLKTEQTQQYISALAENLSKGKKIPLEENHIVRVKKGGNQSGTWLHPKLAIHFARWLDPRFAVWCDEQIEQILSGSLKTKTTADERTPLRQAVSALVGLRGVDYSSAYNMVHQRFGVAAIEDLPREKLSDAVQYVHTLTLGGLQGEILDKPHFDPHAENDAVNDLLCVMRYADRLGKYTRKLAQHLHILDSGLLVHMVTTASEMRRPLKNALHYLEERAAGLPVNGMYNNAKFARQVLEDFHNPAIS